MKKRLPVVMCILFTVLFVFGRTDVKAEKVKWNYKKMIEETKGAFTYHAITAKNKNEAWIYRIDINEAKNPEKLSIPKKLKGRKVTRLGAAEKIEKVYDSTMNIFGSWVERFHDCPGDTPQVTRIKQLKIPDTVTVIQPTTFSGMASIKKVTIPKKVKELKKETFYGCYSLKNVNLPTGLTKMDAAAFQDCPNLKNLKLSAKNKTYQIKDNCVITKKKKELIYVLPTGQPLDIPAGTKIIKRYALNNATSPIVNIPASVEKIEGEAFAVALQGTNGDIKDVTVSEDNAVYARDGQCIYDKTKKSLSVAIVNEDRNVRISDQIERLDKTCNLVNIDIYEDHCEKLIFPAALKSVQVPAFNYIEARKVYFLGSNPPAVENVIEHLSSLPTNADIYILKDFLEVYQEWYKTYDCYEYVDNWYTFLSEEEI